MSKPILCLDFDGVCHSYTSGWQGVAVCNDAPVAGLEAFLRKAIASFAVHIYSSRSSEQSGRDAMLDWFAAWLPMSLVGHLSFPKDKPPAMITLDDRAITFTGVWPEIETLRQFEPWTKHSAPPNERPSV